MTTASITPDLRDGTFFGIGNPLLDINARVQPQFLEKYKLEPNGAILATDEHKGLFREIKREAQSRSFAGGSAQNVMRTIIWFLQKPKVAAYMGCVGSDSSFESLEELAEKAGLITSYEVNPNFSTGTCAVLTTHHGRSMIASLGASQHFSIDHLTSPKNRLLFENAKIICCEAFFIQTSFESLLELAHYAYRNQKIFCITLSSKYIVQNRAGAHLLTAWQYADYVFGHEEETKLFVKTYLNLQTDDLQTSIKALIDLPKLNNARPRTIVISRVPERTLVGTSTGVTEYTWRTPSTEVDTHGCGEAFAGGFLAYVALEKTIDECTKAGMYCAYECLQQTGCSFPDSPPYDPIAFWK